MSTVNTLRNTWLSVNQDINYKIINIFIYSKLLQNSSSSSLILLSIHNNVWHTLACAEKGPGSCENLNVVYSVWHCGYVCCFLALPINVLIYATRHSSHVLGFFLISVDRYILPHTVSVLAWWTSMPFSRILNGFMQFQQLFSLVIIEIVHKFLT